MAGLPTLLAHKEGGRLAAHAACYWRAHRAAAKPAAVAAIAAALLLLLLSLLPTRSRGMSRSSLPCFRNTLPAVCCGLMPTPSADSVGRHADINIVSIVQRNTQVVKAGRRAGWGPDTRHEQSWHTLRRRGGPALRTICDDGAGGSRHLELQRKVECR